jgi:hypothetical protein
VSRGIRLQPGDLDRFIGELRWAPAQDRFDACDTLTWAPVRAISRRKL